MRSRPILNLFSRVKKKKTENDFNTFIAVILYFYVREKVKLFLFI